MKYLVSGYGGPGFASPEEALSVLEEVILPSFEVLEKLEAEGKILAGGLPVGDRAFVFIVEAVSNDEVDRIVRGIPMWGELDWDVVPLQDFTERAAYERDAAAKIKKG